MDEMIQAMVAVFTPGTEMFQITLLTLEMALFSTTISMAIGVPLGVLVGLKEFRGKRLLLRILNTLMGLPPVLAGLIVFFILSRSGPLGSMRLLYTLPAMVIAQVILITPILCGVTATNVADVSKRMHETARGCGMSRGLELAYLIYECRGQLISLVFLAFGRSIGEVGAVSLVGGNVQYQTRVMTTAIMLETNRGNFEYAVALGITLLIISFVVNALVLSVVERMGAPRKGRARISEKKEIESLEQPALAVMEDAWTLQKHSFVWNLEDVQKSFGDRTVLNIPQLKLLSGHVYALVGPNGSGKSTLLRILSGLLAPTRGQAKAPEGVRVGFMPQQSFAFGVSVLRNVMLGIHDRSLSKEEKKARASKALELVGMEHLAHQRGSTLSGGETQRVAIARLIVGRWNALFLDEPTSAMDVQGSVAVEKILQDYSEHTGVLFIVSTHQPSQARRISDEAILLINGHLAQQGTIEAIIAHPANEAVKEFMTYWAL